MRTLENVTQDLREALAAVQMCESRINNFILGDSRIQLDYYQKALQRHKRDAALLSKIRNKIICEERDYS